MVSHKNRYAQHQKLAKQIIRSIQDTFPEARIFERHVGLFYTRNGFPVKINQPGMSDLWVLINSFHIEIEIKSGSGQLSKPQKAWRNTVLKTGHHFIEARSIEQTIKELGEIISGKRNT